ncbi:ABC transporter ATP-binding protein [Zhaonella formicivorans]|uniref:ABC transporter ATP-binding protein n=1 Tax=Zhaonella formicivorans TaxID=2528593 RepID=UPI001D12B694|nr:ABC transporter ATP-binding protein [Zhaonella formicivorans]
MLKVEDVRKTFNKGSVNEKIALDGVTLHLEAGDFVTVIGGNGAGKSTLMNIIAGVYPPDQGSVSLDGSVLTLLPEHRRAAYIGRVFQDPMLGTAASMTIEENLAMALRRGKKRGLKWGVTREEQHFFKEQLAKLELGLENRLRAKVGLLSGGQRQALTLLMATINKPKLLLLDEHTAALDPKTAQKVLDLTDKIVKTDSLTTLMVTHNMRDALKYGNRTIMMHEGKIILDIDSSEKKKLQVDDLLKLFERTSGSAMVNDRLLLA